MPSFFTRLFSLALNTLIALMMLVILLIIAYALLGRYSIPLVKDHNAFIFKKASELSGFDIKADRLEGSLDHYYPVFYLRNLKVKAIQSDTLLSLSESPSPSLPEPSHALTIEELKVTIDPLASVRSRQLRLRSLYVNGVRASIEQQEDGKWRLQGFPKTKGSNLEKFKDFVRHIETVDIAQTWLEFTRLNGGQSLVGPATLQLKREHDFRRLIGSLQPSGDASSTYYKQANLTPEDASKGVFLLFESHGDIFDLESLRLNGYIKTGESDVSKHLSSLAPDFILHQLQVNSQLWLNWSQQKGLALRGMIDKASVGLASVKKSIKIDQVSGDFLLDYQKGRWQGWLPQLSLKHLGHSVDLNQVHIETKANSLDNLYADIAHIEVGDITQILSESKLFSASLRRIISGINAKGDLNQLHAVIPLQRSRLGDLRLTAQAKNIRSKAWKGIPGLTPVNGEIEASLTQGAFRFTDQTVDIDFAPIYKSLMPFQSLSGTVDWNILSDRFTVGARHLSGRGLFGQVDLAFHLDLPKKKGDFDPSIILSAGLVNGNLAHRNLLIPEVLNPSLQKWLDNSILKGRVESGRFLYRGKLVKRSDESPTVQLIAKAKDVAIDYQKPWPKVVNVNGELRIEDGNVSAIVPSASIQSLRLKKAKVALVKSATGSPHQITVDGQFQGSAFHALRFLQKTPIRDQLGGFVDQWQANSGSVSGEVSLHVPLLSTAPPLDVATELSFHDATFSMSEQRLSFERLGGEVSYTTSAGVQSQNLEGRFWGEPFKATIRNDLSLSPSLLFIQADALVNAERLKTWTELPLLTFAQGKAPVKAVFTVQGEAVDLNLTSTLKGMSIDLPKPLAKPVDVARDFNFSLSLSDEKRPWLMRYGSQAKAQFHRVDGELRRGQIILGENKPKNSGEFQDSDEFKDSIDPVLKVSGSLDSFDLDEWLAAQSQLEKAELGMAKRLGKSRLSPSSDSKVNFQESSDEAKMLPIQIRGIKLKRVTAFDQVLHDVKASAYQFDDRWRIQIENDIVAGSVEVFDGDKPMAIALDRLQLKPLIQNNEKAEQAGTVTKPSPLGYTPFNITIANMKNGEENYGRWSFQLRPLADGIELQNLQAQFKGLNIGGEGSKNKNQGALVRWREGSDGVQVTEFDGFLLCDDMGYVLKQWGYEPIITSKKCRYDANVNWPGTPVDFDMNTISGTNNFRLEEGSFASIPDGATSALKVVGILNLSRILQRIQLDFSDLSSDGLAFDWIEGQVKAEEGVMLLDKPLVIKGSSSEMRLSGIVDVPDENMNAEMVVTLPIGSNLPWIAALAVNLPAAAGVFVVSKILKKQVDKLSSAVYSLKGPWDNPEVKFERLFDDKGKGVSLEAHNQNKAAGSSDMKNATTNRSDENALEEDSDDNIDVFWDDDSD